MSPPTPLKRAIFEAGRTQADLALAVGIDQTHLSRIVNGLRANPDTQARIADELDVPVSSLWPDEREAA